jgi:hypothetical protein
MVSGTIPTYHIEPFKVQYTFLNQIKYKKYEGCDLIENYSKLYYTTLIILLALLISPTYASPDIITGSGYSSAVNEGWYVDQYMFYNYCPHCHHIDCLVRGLKRNDELTCVFCDADYSFSGREKVYQNPYYLEPYTPEPVVSKTETPPPEPTPWQKAHTCFKNNQIMIIT